MRVSVNAAAVPSDTRDPSDPIETVGNGPGILATGLFDSIRPSAAQIAPVVPHGRLPGSVATTAPSSEGFTPTRQRTLPGGAARRV